MAKLMRNWPMMIGIALSVLLFVMLITSRTTRGEERSTDTACARVVTRYMAEIERLITAPGLHGAARRATLEDRLQRACLRPR